MDDRAILTPDVSYVKDLLACLELITPAYQVGWCRMRFKPKTFRSMSIVKGKVGAMVFSVVGQVILTVRDELVKSICSRCDASLTNT